MEFNSRSQACAGIGDGFISLDNIPITRGSSACWYDDDHIAFQKLDENAASVVLYDINNQTYETVLNQPAGTVKGGGGTWAAFLANPITFNTSIPGFDNNESGLVAVGQEGQVCYKPLYQSNGPYRIRQKNGVDFHFSDLDIQDVQLILNAEAIWRIGNKLFSQGLPGPIQTYNAGGIWRPRVAHHNGEWYVAYISEQLNGLVVHKLLDKSKFKLFIGSNYFNHNLCSANGNLLIGWASTEGEQPGQITVQPIVQFGDVISEPNKQIMIRAFERPIWQAPYFSHHKRYGDTPKDKHVGNAILVLADDDNFSRFLNIGLPLICDYKLNLPELENLIVCWYCHSTENMEDLKEKVRIAKLLPEKLITAYLDNDDWPDTNPFGPNVVPNIQAYRFPRESLEDFDRRVTAVIEKVDSYNTYMGLSTRFDDFNGDSTVQRIMQCMPIYERWLRDFNFVIHMPFSDRRGNGISKNEQLWNIARAFQFAIPFDRPNRFDYWQPSNISIEEILRNKLGQSRESVVLEKYLRDYILNNDPPANQEPIIDLNLLNNFVNSVYQEHNGQNRGVMLNKIAWQYNLSIGRVELGLSHKPGGNNVEQPHTGIKIAFDIIQVKPPVNEVFSTMYDVFNDNGPIFPHKSNPHNDSNRTWLEAVKP